MESVTTEDPKTVTKLSKLIKQPDINNQQPNKIKYYTESEATDHTLQLGLIKSIFFQRKCSRQHETKTANSKK